MPSVRVLWAPRRGPGDPLLAEGTAGADAIGRPRGRTSPSGLYCGIRIRVRHRHVAAVRPPVVDPGRLPGGGPAVGALDVAIGTGTDGRWTGPTVGVDVPAAVPGHGRLDGSNHVERSFRTHTATQSGGPAGRRGRSRSRSPRRSGSGGGHVGPDRPGDRESVHLVGGPGYRDAGRVRSTVAGDRLDSGSDRSSSDAGRDLRRRRPLEAALDEFGRVY